MTKRFTYIKNSSITQYQAIPIQEIGKGKAYHCQGIVDKLNKLSDENEKLSKENKELKIKNDLLSDELEQAKAVIHKKWNEYLKKKELI